MPDQPVVPGRGPGRPGWPRRIARGGRARLGWAGQGELGGLVSWAEPPDPARARLGWVGSGQARAGRAEGSARSANSAALVSSQAAQPA